VAAVTAANRLAVCPRKTRLDRHIDKLLRIESEVCAHVFEPGILLAQRSQHLKTGDDAIPVVWRSRQMM
jgi:hypothetical protein